MRKCYDRESFPQEVRRSMKTSSGRMTDCERSRGISPSVREALETGAAQARKRDIVIPDGTPEKAQLGLELVLDAVLELAKANPNGVTNADVWHALGLHRTTGEARRITSAG